MKLAWVIALVLMLIGFAILFRPPRIDETMAPPTVGSTPTSTLAAGELAIRLPERIQVPSTGRLEVILDDGHEKLSWTATAPRAVGRDDLDWISSRLLVPRVAPGDYSLILASSGSPDGTNAFRFTCNVKIRPGTVSTADFSAE